MKLYLLAIFAAFLLAGEALAAPSIGSKCHSSCEKAVKKCYKKAGHKWGAPLANPPAAVVTCNKAFGACKSTCPK
ncbi:hypothetical protein N7478_001697 [Penicillium angulare]|uniref:uncharacterized protein n=1 Tax=Penicillium angulare TaxID=116970 RepID=UPI00254266FF|nr:uncharacterized protein N7478_001697 [Penicillium angulare]KAJ5288667.1 hypothetical protein N7478_001697 [Penicillium angulare]